MTLRAGHGEDPGVNTWTWVSVVRRARLGRTVKGVAMTLASYASPDGASVRPGIAGLAIAAEVDYKTAQNALAALRAAGLIQLVRRAGRRDEFDEYRLILAHDVLDRVAVHTPAQVKAAAGEMRRPRGNAAAATPRQPTPRGDVPGRDPATPVNNTTEVVDKSRSTVDEPPSSVDNPVGGTREPVGTSAHGTPQSTATSAHGTPNVSPPHDPTPISAPVPRQKTSTNHVIGLGPQPPTARARANPTGRCPHGHTTRRTRTGAPRCRQCRAADQKGDTAA